MIETPCGRMYYSHDEGIEEVKINGEEYPLPKGKTEIKFGFNLWDRIRIKVKEILE